MWKTYDCDRTVSLDENTIGFVGEEGSHPSNVDYYTETLMLTPEEALDKYHSNFCYYVDYPAEV